MHKKKKKKKVKKKKKKVIFQSPSEVAVFWPPRTFHILVRIGPGASKPPENGEGAKLTMKKNGKRMISCSHSRPLVG
jgi:hypothetical protein